MSSYRTSTLLRVPSFALLGLIASGGAFAQAPSVPAPPAPAVPMPAPIVTPPPAVVPTVPRVMPQLSGAQADLLRGWLGKGREQGLGDGSAPASALAGDALARAVLERAAALHRGQVDTADFLQVWAIRPAAYDPFPAFERAVREDRLAQWTGNLTPPWAGYDGLRKGLAAYERIEDKGGWPQLATGAAASAVRARLAIEDKGVTPDMPMTEALQRAQKRYGLRPTGLLDARTLSELNVPVRDRIAAIMANMERWRWMPAELPVNRVQVNIAAAVLTVYQDDKPVSSMRAVTGSPDNQTPMLTSSIHSIVVNPPWNVPASIAKRELWPKGRATLIRQGYKIVGTPEKGERIVQPAGPNSALGRLKFDFDNPFAVYLHDTPSRGKFSSYDRLASHGCIRLEKPVPLAEHMMAGAPDVAGRIQDLIDTGKTQRVSLPSQVAVYLLYWTAFASGDGTMNFRTDPYGWDKLLAGKIEASSRREALTLTLKD